MNNVIDVKNQDDEEQIFDCDGEALAVDDVALYLKNVANFQKRQKPYAVLEMTTEFFNKADKAGFIYYHDHHGPMFGNIIVEVSDENV